MIIKPYGFLKGPVEEEVGRTDIPPVDGVSFYYDATNTTYSSASIMKEIVNFGVEPDYNWDNSSTGSSFPNYVSGQYYQWEGSQDMRMTDGELNSSMSFWTDQDHTIFTVQKFDSTAEEDTFSTGTSTGAVLLMAYQTNVRAHVWEGTTLVTDTTGFNVATDQYVVIGQRFDKSAVRVDAFYCESGSAVYIETGSAGSVGSATQAPALAGWGSRGPDRSPNGNYSGSQAAFYQGTYLEASDIQAVCDYMLAKH